MEDGIRLTGWQGKDAENSKLKKQTVEVARLMVMLKCHRHNWYDWQSAKYMNTEVKLQFATLRFP